MASGGPGGGAVGVVGGGLGDPPPPPHPNSVQAKKTKRNRIKKRFNATLAPSRSNGSSKASD